MGSGCLFMPQKGGSSHPVVSFDDFCGHLGASPSLRRAYYESRIKEPPHFQMHYNSDVGSICTRPPFSSFPRLQPPFAAWETVGGPVKVAERGKRCSIRARKGMWLRFWRCLGGWERTRPPTANVIDQMRAPSLNGPGPIFDHPSRPPFDSAYRPSIPGSKKCLRGFCVQGGDFSSPPTPLFYDGKWDVSGHNGSER